MAGNPSGAHIGGTVSNLHQAVRQGKAARFSFRTGPRYARNGAARAIKWPAKYLDPRYSRARARPSARRSAPAVCSRRVSRMETPDHCRGDPCFCPVQRNPRGWPLHKSGSIPHPQHRRRPITMRAVFPPRSTARLDAHVRREQRASQRPIPAQSGSAEKSPVSQTVRQAFVSASSEQQSRKRPAPGCLWAA